MIGLLIYILVGLACIVAIWWVAIPDAPANKAAEITMSFLGAGVLAVAVCGILYGVCEWASMALGHQPLQF